MLDCECWQVAGDNLHDLPDHLLNGLPSQNSDFRIDRSTSADMFSLRLLCLSVSVFHHAAWKNTTGCGLSAVSAMPGMTAAARCQSNESQHPFFLKQAQAPPL